MYCSVGGFSVSDSMAENRKKRNIERNRKNLVALNLRIGGVIKTINGVEVISDFNNKLAQIKTFSGHQYGPTEIIKVG